MLARFFRPPQVYLNIQPYTKAELSMSLFF